MAQVCEVTGKRPQSGNNVSHAHNKTRRRFAPNLHYHRFWVPSENRFVRLRVSAAGMRIIDKKGIEVVLEEIRARKSSGGKRARQGGANTAAPAVDAAPATDASAADATDQHDDQHTDQHTGQGATPPHEED